VGQLYLFQRATFWSQSCCQVCCSRLTRDRGRAAGRGARYPLNNPFFDPFSTDCSKPIYAPRSQARAVRPAMGKKRSAAQLEALQAARAAHQDGASSPAISEQLNESPALVAHSAAALTSPQVAARPRRSVVCGSWWGSLTLSLCLFVSPDFITLSARGTPATALLLRPSCLAATPPRAFSQLL
jgi:hypothetical protein